MEKVQSIVAFHQVSSILAPQTAQYSTPRADAAQAEASHVFTGVNDVR